LASTSFCSRPLAFRFFESKLQFIRIVLSSLRTHLVASFVGGFGSISEDEVSRKTLRKNSREWSLMGMAKE
jgi:hypothetical protein